MISIVIPVFNDPVALRRCLEAIGAQSLSPGQFEAIVVDNGSAIGIADVVREFGFASCLFESRPGSYNARNTGARAASGEILAFTDADCIPRPDWLERARRHFAADDRVAAIGGRIDLVVSGARTTAELFETVFPSFLQEQYVQQMGFAATANLFVRRVDFLAVGPFDGARMSSGDKEWGRRLGASGRILRYADDAVVEHPARTSIAALIRKHRRIVGGRVAGPGQEAPTLYEPWSRRIRQGVSGTLLTLLLRPARLSLSRLESTRVIALVAVVGVARVWERTRLALGARPIR